MALALIQMHKGEAYDCDGNLYEYVVSEDRICDDHDGHEVIPAGWETSDRVVCDDCVNVVSISDATDAIEQIAALKNAFEFIFGKSKCKTNDEVIQLHCHDCKQLIKFGQDVRYQGYSYCTDCFFEDKHDAKPT